MAGNARVLTPEKVHEPTGMNAEAKIYPSDPGTCHDAESRVRYRSRGIARSIQPLAKGDITHLHIGFKGTMNALFLKDLAEKTHRGLRGESRTGSRPAVFATAIAWSRRSTQEV